VPRTREGGIKEYRRITLLRRYPLNSTNYAKQAALTFGERDGSSRAAVEDEPQYLLFDRNINAEFARQALAGPFRPRQATISRLRRTQNATRKTIADKAQNIQ
jgi:hypothetical protein